MTDAPKIDTQAPDTSREYIQRMIACAPFADQTAGIPEMVATLRALLAERDLADARAAAAWIAGRDAALADYIEWGELGCSPSRELVSNSIRALTPPADASAALDRLIAEGVDAMWRECLGALPEMEAEYVYSGWVLKTFMDNMLAIRAARGSKEGRDGPR